MDVCQMCGEKLKRLQKMLMRGYIAYRSGELSEEAYLAYAKPIDKAIERLEMATLLDTPVLRGSSSPQVHRQESLAESHDRSGE